MVVACVAELSVENVTVEAVPITLSCSSPVCEVSSLEHPASATTAHNINRVLPRKKYVH